MSIAHTTLVVAHEAGLHARPLSKFVKTARQFESSIEVTNLTRDKGPVQATSPLKLMLLAVLNGHEIKISAEGDDADTAITALATLVENNFETEGEGHV